MSWEISTGSIVYRGPDYMRKLPALYYEFEETRTSRMGNDVPGGSRTPPELFWTMVSEHIKPGISYLKRTERGSSCLYSRVQPEHRSCWLRRAMFTPRDIVLEASSII